MTSCKNRLNFLALLPISPFALAETASNEQLDWATTFGSLIFVVDLSCFSHGY